MDFDFQVLMTCGRNVVQERTPAVIPIISGFIVSAEYVKYEDKR